MAHSPVHTPSQASARLYSLLWSSTLKVNIDGADDLAAPALGTMNVDVRMPSPVTRWIDNSRRCSGCSFQKQAFLPAVHEGHNNRGILMLFVLIKLQEVESMWKGAFQHRQRHSADLDSAVSWCQSSNMAHDQLGNASHSCTKAGMS